MRTFAGKLGESSGYQNAFDLTKAGPGTLILTGDNEYVKWSTVKLGTLPLYSITTCGIRTYERR